MAAKLTKSAKGVTSNFLTKAGTAISIGLKSCDDTEAINEEELIVPNFRAQERASEQSRRKALGARLAECRDIDSSLTTRYWGTASFQMKLEFHAVDQQKSVRVTAWEEIGPSRSRQPINITVSWKRSCAGHVFDSVTQREANPLPVTADDVGCSLVAEVRSIGGNGGVLHGEIGPFDLDGDMRSALEQFLAANGSTFSLDLRDINSTLDDSRGLVLSVTSEEVKLTKVGPRNVGFTQCWTRKMDSSTKIVQVDASSATGLRLYFANDEVVEALALTQRQRDTIALLIRAFQGRKVAQTAALLEQVSFNTQTLLQSADGTTTPSMSSQLDFFIIFDQLSRQLSESLVHSASAIREREQAVKEREALEEDLASTIETYRQLLANAGYEAAESSQRTAIVTELQTELKESRIAVQKYTEDNELLRRENRDLQAKLKEKSSQLKAWMDTPTSKLAETDNGTRLRELEAQLRELEEMNLSLKADRKDKNMRGDRKELAEALREIEALKLKLQSAEETNQSMQTRLDLLKKRNDEIESKHRMFAEEQIDLTEALSKSERTSKREIEQKTLQLKDTEQQLRDIKQKYQRLTQEDSKLRSDNQTLKDTVNQLNLKLDMEMKKFINMNQTLLLERDRLAETVREQASGTSLERDTVIARLQAENEELQQKIRKLALST